MAATKRTRTPSGLTPQLRAAFDTLLLTWRLREARGEVVVPIPEKSPTWALDCEERFGDGHYASRKDSLGTTLALLDKEGKTDFAAVVAALQWARDVEVVVTMRGRSLVRARTLEMERDRVHRHLSKWLPRALQLCKGSRTSIFVNAGLGKDPALVRHLEALLAALQPGTCNLLTLEWLPPGHTGRRSRRGAPEKPWMAELDRRLARAGVPLESRKALLKATGFLPYSDR